MNKFIILFLIVGLAACMVSASGFSVSLVEAKDSDSGGDSGDDDSSNSGTSDNGDNDGSDSGPSDNGDDSGSNDNSDSGDSSTTGVDDGDNSATGDNSDHRTTDTNNADQATTTDQSQATTADQSTAVDTSTATAAQSQSTSSPTQTVVVNPMLPAITAATNPDTNIVPQEDAAKLPKCNGTAHDCRTDPGGDICLKDSGAHECECDGPHDPNCKHTDKHQGSYDHGHNTRVVLIHKTKTIHQKDSHSIPTVFVPEVGLVQPLNCKLNQDNGRIGCEFVVIKVIN